MSGQRGIRTDGEQERWIKSENSNGSRRRREIIISGVEIHECKGYKKYETLNEMEQKEKGRKKILSISSFRKKFENLNSFKEPKIGRKKKSKVRGNTKMKNTKFVKITKRKKKIRKRQVDEEEETIFQGSFDS